MNNWEIVSQALINLNLEAEVNYKDHYFVCPYCGKRVYQEDWTEGEYIGIFGLACPLCGATIDYFDTEE